MSWIVSLGIVCLFLIFGIVGISVASSLGIILRVIIDKLPKWLVLVLFLLLLIGGLTFMFHYAIYGRL